MGKAHHPLFVFWLSVACVAFTLPLRACSVPVFRYALERWPSDAYQAVVFHRGPLSEAQQAELKNLTSDGLAGRWHSNISVRDLDLDQNPEPASLALWEQSKGATLPWVVVRHVDAAHVISTFWSGPLAESATRQLLDSPLRKEIVRRLAAGESVVWALLESGDPRKDDEAATLLQTRLAYLAGVLQLPKLDPQDLLEFAAESPLQLSFSTMRVSRQDAAEQAFVQMLLGSEPELAEIAEPIVFPIFGRGRVLYALAGKGINSEHIDEASSFLIGACSCQVKEQNPGVDLLVSADWDQLITPTLSPDIATPPRAKLASESPGTFATAPGAGKRNDAAENNTAVDVVSFRPPENAAPAKSGLHNSFLIGGAVLAALAAVTLFLRRRS